jgi:ketosteroid isomerase-like protein
MQRATEHATDEAQITDLLAAFTDAIRQKNAHAAVALYARDVVAYDLAPPLRIEGSTMRDPRYIQQWFDTWDGPIESEARGLEIVTGGDVAYAFGLRHMTGTKKDGEHVDLWFRATACLRREDGTWKIAHVHNSVPFAMDGSGRALLDLEP